MNANCKLPAQLHEPGEGTAILEHKWLKPLAIRRATLVPSTFGTGVLHLIQINHQPDATIFSFYYPDVCLQLNMFRAFSRPSSGAQ